MYYSSNSSEWCPKLEQRVEITVSVEAEMGFGCALDLGEQEYSCSRRETCGLAGTEGCLLTALRTE